MARHGGKESGYCRQIGERSRPPDGAAAGQVRANQAELSILGLDGLVFRGILNIDLESGFDPERYRFVFPYTAWILRTGTEGCKKSTRHAFPTGRLFLWGTRGNHSLCG
jgi:hypothetical protein